MQHLTDSWEIRYYCGDVNAKYAVQNIDSSRRSDGAVLINESEHLELPEYSPVKLQGQDLEIGQILDQDDR